MSKYSTLPSSRNSLESLKTSQIVCLEHHPYFLYGDVIDLVSAKNLFWVRPSILQIQPDDALKIASKKIIDVRFTSDLLLPIPWFRVAFDSELIPLLGSLEDSHLVSVSDRQNARQELQQFLKYFMRQKYDPSLA